MFGPPRDKSFSWAKPALESLDLAGRSLVVVGGTDGLGRAITLAAAGRGAAVTVVGRTNRLEVRSYYRLQPCLLLPSWSTHA